MKGAIQRRAGHQSEELWSDIRRGKHVGAVDIADISCEKTGTSLLTGSIPAMKATESATFIGWVGSRPLTVDSLRRTVSPDQATECFSIPSKQKCFRTYLG